MDDRDYRDLEKAGSLASWSYIGILIPLIGLILGFMSKSRLNDLPKQLDDRDTRKVRKVRERANGGIAFSILFFIIGAAVSWFIMTAPNQNTDTTTPPDKPAAGWAQPQTTPVVDNQTQLNTCIDGVNERYADAMNKAQYITQQQQLLADKQQLIQECQIKYPTN